VLEGTFEARTSSMQDPKTLPGHPKCRKTRIEANSVIPQDYRFASSNM
jgi:hypothetical protein